MERVRYILTPSGLLMGVILMDIEPRFALIICLKSLALWDGVSRSDIHSGSRERAESSADVRSEMSKYSSA